MASVFTIQGPELEGEGLGKVEYCTRDKGRVRTAKVGDCKTVKNRRTHCTYEMCCVGKGKSRTQWAFKVDSYSCPQGRAKKVPK
jgi:hypothetical protein